VSRLPAVGGLLALLLLAGQAPAQAPPAEAVVDQPADVVVEGNQAGPIPTEPPATAIVIQPVQAQRGGAQPGQPGLAGQGGIPAPKSQETSYYGVIMSELPGPERLFQLDPEPALNERIRQDYRDRGDTKVTFPEDPVVTREPFAPRSWPCKYCWAEPNYVCYNRLYFQQPNAERWGWDFGIMEPFMSAGWFFADVLVLPYHAGTDPCRCHECSAGYCLPGDPVPYRLFPPGLSATGAFYEAAFVTALFLIFP
jgi:hypothetical protein